MTEAADEQAQPQESDEPSVTGLTYRQVTPGVWDVTQAEFERKVDADRHRRGLAGERQTHELEEARKDNDQRRREQDISFRLGIVAIVVVLGVALTSIFVVDNEQTKEWARSMTTLIVGALAGYFTGKTRK